MYEKGSAARGCQPCKFAAQPAQPSPRSRSTLDPLWRARSFFAEVPVLFFFELASLDMLLILVRLSVLFDPPVEFIEVVFFFTAGEHFF